MEFMVTDGAEGKVKALVWDQQLSDDEVNKIDWKQAFKSNVDWVKCYLVKTKPGTNHDDMLAARVCGANDKRPIGVDRVGQVNLDPELDAETSPLDAAAESGTTGAAARAKGDLQ